MSGKASSDAPEIGRSERSEDLVWPLSVRGLAATLDEPFEADGPLPPLWHWVLFQEWTPGAQLALDGHAPRGGLLPVLAEFPLRMWGGGRLSFHEATLLPGDRVTRVSTLLRVDEKRGASGPFAVVTLGHELTGPRGPVLSEEQQLIYRGSTGRTRADEPAGEKDASVQFSRTVPITSTLLFRYSALTGNAHRIHYDETYAREVAGHAGLVIHGPLQATLLAQLLRQQYPERRLRTFSYRALRPAIAPMDLLLEGWEADGAVKLQSGPAGGAVCMSAEAAIE
jgi:hydroxyacyl-ACP dehydratase HTD2-like protein with hotdog domain